jgi:hypothetical protein
MFVSSHVASPAKRPVGRYLIEFVLSIHISSHVPYLMIFKISCPDKMKRFLYVLKFLSRDEDRISSQWEGGKKRGSKGVVLQHILGVIINFFLPFLFVTWVTSHLEGIEHQCVGFLTYAEIQCGNGQIPSQSVIYYLEWVFRILRKLNKEQHLEVKPQDWLNVPNVLVIDFCQSLPWSGFVPLPGFF